MYKDFVLKMRQNRMIQTLWLVLHLSSAVKQTIAVQPGKLILCFSPRVRVFIFRSFAGLF